MRILPTFQSYTVDYRLGQFRRVPLDEEPEFIEFESEQGQRLLEGVRQDQSLVIRHEGEDPSAWVCVCGNRTTEDGFVGCTWAGDAVASWVAIVDTGLYSCRHCGRIIDAGSLAVMSLASMEERG